jgi:hypothetical protein
MARKFGKKVEIKLSPLDYNIGLLGESGIGKSTIIKEVCEKLVGEDGYLALDVGKEDGHDAINGIQSEKIEDWDKFIEVTDDIIENKDTDWKELKVVVIDTYDQLFELAEQEAIRLYNKKNTDKPKAETINEAWGGFGAGLDKTIELVLDRLWELKKVGVSFIVIAHTKKKDVDDPVSGQQYSILTSNISQKYFNAIKTKLHFLGMAYVDREIIQEKTGKKNLKTGKDIEKGKVVNESRVIRFRDDSYSVDSKCRFANIIDSIPFDSDELIKALKEAILVEQSKSGVSIEEAQAKQNKNAEIKGKAATEYIENKKKNKVDEKKNAELIDIIKAKYPKATDEAKEQIKVIMAENKIENFKSIDVPTKGLEEIVTLLC